METRDLCALCAVGLGLGGGGGGGAGRFCLYKLIVTCWWESDKMSPWVPVMEEQVWDSVSHPPPPYRLPPSSRWQPPHRARGTEGVNMADREAGRPAHSKTLEVSDVSGSCDCLSCQKKKVKKKYIKKNSPSSPPLAPFYAIYTHVRRLLCQSHLWPRQPFERSVCLPFPRSSIHRV